MLKSLFIQNFALIDSLKIEFDNGFSVITGETGAGKSIILGALSLILGQRADTTHIKQNASKCIIEGIFDIADYHLKPVFDANDWEYDGNICILRREIWSSGKSRAFLNDSPVYLNDLKILGERLIDIHSQHQNLALNDNLFQLDVVDILSKTESLKADYIAAYLDFSESENQLLQLKEAAQKSNEEADYLRFQFMQLADAQLQPNEQNDLETELEQTTHAEEIKSALFAVSSTLAGDDTNVESLLKSALNNAHTIRAVFPKIEEFAARIESAYLDLKDVATETEKLFDEIEFNQERLQYLEDRLSVIYDLQKKHQVNSVDELLKIQNDLDTRLQQIDSFDEQITSLEKATAAKRQEMLAKAQALSKKRQKGAKTIEKQLIEKLAFVGMPSAQFMCRFAKKNADKTGTDRIEFLFSANKNVGLQPVAQIASGGEVSRLILCIKSMIAGAKALPTIIFDEVDTGTSGEIADKMGVIMQTMSRDMQVIAITHLPQIAAKGNAHFVVYKEEKTDDTVTLMRKLSSDERIDEIARMLSGARTTREAIENAKVMLRG